MIQKFKSRKEVSKYLAEKGIDTKDWSEEKWLSLNTGQAEIHMMALAEAMYDAMNESTPQQLKAGEWHIPFGDQIDENKMLTIKNQIYGEDVHYDELNLLKIKIATARCARVSYINYEGKDDYEADFKLFEILKQSVHASPFEHCAKAMSKEDLDNYLLIEDGKTFVGRCRNFNGFIQLRQTMGL